jgi:hypothetical protein
MSDYKVFVKGVRDFLTHFKIDGDKGLLILHTQRAGSELHYLLRDISRMPCDDSVKGIPILVLQPNEKIEHYNIAAMNSIGWYRKEQLNDIQRSSSGTL